ncbi:general substrate transporter [Hyphopichia burtonii NRRL Y-1933]|uniref:General substrate transporter n=1 Tax=Hyphopichia burtonii NRRL Y-1933 TaxID=984485 RepID=A0A1E4RDQ1_9ASCO|nr:general substrate transporter [Hyphopichia burtonii NRRL Y-1933]ODV65356.1 general substrate transporter [Hyphopichia burtonii NRRL Y-1933]
MFQDLSFFVIKIIVACCLGSLTYGFSSGVAGTVSGLPSFIDYFDYESNANKADAFNGLFSGGGLLGCLLAGHFSEQFGRKRAIFITCMISILGSIIMTASVNIAMLFVARFIAGVSIGMIVFLVPLWQTEIAPASVRGLLVGMHGTMNIAGYSICNWVNVGLYFCSNVNAQWRVTLALQMVWPLALAICIWWMPESPRWLIEHGKVDEAREVMKHLESELNDDQFSHMVYQIENENQHSSWSSLFTVKPYRKRLIIGFLTMFAGQATGTLVVTNYTPTLCKSLHFDSLMQLILSAAYISTGVVYNFVCALMMDYVGRKTLLIVGIFGSGVISIMGELIMVALFSGSDNKAANAAGVFFIFFHIVFYGGCVDANTYVYATEIWPTHIRSKGAALSTSGLFIGLLVFTTGVTSALNHIQWRYFLIFIILSLINCIIIFFYFPETKGLTLEEIGKLFGEDPDITDNKLLFIEGTHESTNLKDERVAVQVKEKDSYSP